MTETIWVRVADPSKRNTTFWDVSDEHPGGEVFVSGDRVVEVAKTPLVEQKLAKRVLVQVDAPEPETVSFTFTGTSFAGSQELGVTVHPGGYTQDDDDDDDDDDPLVAAVGNAAAALLIEAGYDSPERVQATTDEELLAVPGIGPKSLEKIREALPQSDPADGAVQQSGADDSGEQTPPVPSQQPQQPSPSSLTPPVPNQPTTPPSQQDAPPQS